MDGQVQVGAVYNVAPGPVRELRWIAQWSKTSRGWRRMVVVV